MRLSGFAKDPVLGLRAEVLAWRLLFGLGSLRVGSAPYGWSFGAQGVGIHADGPELIVVLAPSGLVPGSQPVPLAAVPAIANAVASVSLPGENWDDVHVWGIADPVQHVGAGDPITAAKNGTAGAPVRWTAAGGAATYGVLTAGHVAGAASTPVTTRWGRHVGTVADCELPATAGVDVAAIGLPAAASSPSLIGSALTGKNNVEILSAVTKPGVVIAKAGWLFWSGYGVTYVDLYITSSPVSVGGDSGSAVVLAGTREFIGSLVGASVGSLIQDGATQIGALSRLTGLSL